ncbi:phosphate ABC transporter substrate-binding protein PstS family protein [Brochothrix campestris]|uniref:Phosphate-binding protein n=1 Tax=Brochothrix campestris FSL F6-1037 TaxID=1265861 RepID=W7CP35_9LIST|nr:phosphate ABC transporter substrate-binding protein PstS family protein [Brochothrix campestris]EUJ41354.1 putative phosphate ABC transporter binding protein [Brochothrix campestris FSL F6-1037]
MKKTIGLFSIIVVASLVLVACGNNEKEGKASAEMTGTITAVGSSALQPLAEEVGKAFTAENSKVTVNVQGGGSGQGLSQIAAGTVDIGNSDVFAEEKTGVDTAKIKDNKVAVVGMGPIVNPDTGVTNLAKEQLVGIFTGKITNWKEVGGKDLAITVINRAEGSGTRATFEKWALDGKESVKAQEQDNSGTVRQMVAKTPGAISYLAFSYFDDAVTALTIDKVKPTEANVQTNDWKIWAYEHMYTKKDANKQTEAFIDYMLSDDVQTGVVTELGYSSVNAMKVERSVDGKVTTK